MVRFSNLDQLNFHCQINVLRRRDFAKHLEITFYVDSSSSRRDSFLIHKLTTQRRMINTLAESFHLAVLTKLANWVK